MGLALFTTLFTGRGGSVSESAADFVDAFQLPMFLLAVVAAVGAVANQALVKTPPPPADREPSDR